MKTFKRIVTIIISLAYVVFLFLCATSPAAGVQREDVGNPVVASTDMTAKPVSQGRCSCSASAIPTTRRS